MTFHCGRNCHDLARPIFSSALTDLSQAPLVLDLCRRTQSTALDALFKVTCVHCGANLLASECSLSTCRRGGRAGAWWGCCVFCTVCRWVPQASVQVLGWRNVGSGPFLPFPFRVFVRQQ